MGSHLGKVWWLWFKVEWGECREVGFARCRERFSKKVGALNLQNHETPPLPSLSSIRNGGEGARRAGEEPLCFSGEQ